MPLLIPLVLTLLWILSLFVCIEAAQVKEGTVSNGVRIQGIDCGGMTSSEVTQAVNEKVAQMGQAVVNMKVGDQSVSATLNDLGIRWSNREILDEVMNLGATGNIVKRYKDRKDLEHQNREFTLTFELDQNTIETWTAGLAVYNTQPVNATIFTRDDLTPGVDGGTDGIVVDTAGSAKLLTKVVKLWDGVSQINLELPVTRTSPDVTYDELAIVCDVLGTATTDYSASSAARAVNVENGCRKITGTLLHPGDRFSVTEAVTPFTAENGYEQAPTYEENRVVDSYGGGICQVSTTLYNAVLKAELEVTARSNHTMVVGYVALSKDAAIAEGVMDMSFINTTEWPIYIIGYTYGGTITFTIFGHETRPSNRTLEFESRTLQTIEPTAAKIIANTSQNVGYINQTQAPHTGYVAELWKNIYIDGQFTDSVQINSSTYTAVGTIYDVGVASPLPGVTQAMNAAIATGDLAQVQATIANANAIAQQAQQQALQQQQQQQQGGGSVVIGEGGDVDESLSNP